MNESLIFFRQFSRSTVTVGSLVPTSRFAAHAMASEMIRRAGPRRILEVGPGTGPITAEIVRHMRPDDHLVLCELNDEFVAYLRERIDDDPEFAGRAAQITLLHTDVLDLDADDRFDLIVSAIPFVNCPPEMVERIFAFYRVILKPGGVLSFIEYAYMRAIRVRLLPADVRRQAEAAIAVMNAHVEPYVFRRDLVIRNFPPTWVRHLRFVPPQTEDAAVLRPLQHTERIRLGATAGLASAAVPFILGVLAVGLVLMAIPGALALAIVLAIGVAAFFRDPARATPFDRDAAYAAADGRVLSVEEVEDDRLGGGRWLRVAAFLAITDVHINRSPVAGRVVDRFDRAGGFAHAGTGPAEHNHARYTVIDGLRGPCVVAQRVGAVARRIVTWGDVGDLVAQGERYGLICFGSRTDIYLPAGDWTPCVRTGERVTGGITVLARYTGDGPR